MGTRVRVVHPINARRLWLPWACLAVLAGVVLAMLASLGYVLAIPWMFRNGSGGIGLVGSSLLALTVVTGIGAGLVVGPLLLRVWFGRGALILALLVISGITLGAIVGVFALQSDSLVHVFPLFSWPTVYGWPILVPLPVFSLVSCTGAILFGLIFATIVAGRRVPQRGMLCTICAYDLRGMPPEGTRCPECGSNVHQPRRWSWVMRWFVIEPPGWRLVASCGVAFVLVFCAWFGVVRLLPLLELQYGVGRGHIAQSRFGTASVWIPDTLRPDRYFRVEFTPGHLFRLFHSMPPSMNIEVSGRCNPNWMAAPDHGSVRVTACIVGGKAQRQLRREGIPQGLLDELRRKADETGWQPSPVGLLKTPGVIPVPSESIAFDGTPYFSQSTPPGPVVPP